MCSIAKMKDEISMERRRVIVLSLFSVCTGGHEGVCGSRSQAMVAIVYETHKLIAWWLAVNDVDQSLYWDLIVGAFV